MAWTADAQAGAHRVSRLTHRRILRGGPTRTHRDCPDARTRFRFDRQRAELVERERPVTFVLQQMLDPSELRLPFRIRRLLPGLGSLERDLLLSKDLPQPFTRHHHLAVLLRRQIPGELADRPACERLTQRAGSLLGRLDDQLTLSRRDPAGPATRPPRVQRSHPQLVEPVDHLPNPVRARLDQPGDHRHVVAARRRQHDQRPPPLHDRLIGPAPTPTHDPLQLPALVVGQSTHPHPFSNTTSLRDPPHQMVDAPLKPSRSEH